MTVFVAGIHGVGKSYLCQKYAQDHDVIHESASSLIRKEQSQPNWSIDKKVLSVEDNQRILTSAVKRISAEGRSLLLDGHFVLLDVKSKFVHIPLSTFKTLEISGAILVETDSDTVSERLKLRDGTESTVDIESFIQAERLQAQMVCAALRIPLYILHTPDLGEFSTVASALFNFATASQVN